MNIIRFLSIVGFLLAIGWGVDQIRTRHFSSKSQVFQKRQKVYQAKAQEVSVRTYESPGLAAEISRNPDANLKTILAFENRNPEAIFARGGKLQDQLVAAAKEIVPRLSRCLTDGSRCGSNEEWDNYFAMGGSTFHQALDRSMSVIKLASDSGQKYLVSRKDLLLALQIPHHSISVTAMDLLTSEDMSSADLQEVIGQSDHLRGRAKKLYFNMLSKTMSDFKNPDDRQAYVQSLFRAVSDSSDPTTRMHVISGLPKYGLSSAEFSKAIRLACRGLQDGTGENIQARMAANLESSARRNGYNTPTKSICLNSNLAEVVDR